MAMCMRIYEMSPFCIDSTPVLQISHVHKSPSNPKRSVRLSVDGQNDPRGSRLKVHVEKSVQFTRAYVSCVAPSFTRTFGPASLLSAKHSSESGHRLAEHLSS